MSTAGTSFYGYIETTRDSLLILEACKRGLLPRVNRRLQEKERELVQSGAVFCFDENESGIKRWTDGLVWSPSRILGNFLVYRELDKRSSQTDEMGRAGMQHLSDRQRERALVGSLTNSYRFRRDGLIKKSMSLAINGVQQHLVSYYTKEDVLSRRLSTPSTVPELSALEISPELLLQQNFRIPLFLADTEVKKIPRSLEMTSSRMPRKENGFELNLERSTLRMKRRYNKNQRRNSDSRALMQQPDGCICGGSRASLSASDIAPLTLPPSPLSASQIPIATHSLKYHIHHQPHHQQLQSELPTPPTVLIPPSAPSPTTATAAAPIPSYLPAIPQSSTYYGTGSANPMTPLFNDRQEQNPHQLYFSSTSFHAINHSVVPIMRNEIASNAFMADQSLFLGLGWNEFEMQM